MHDKPTDERPIDAFSQWFTTNLDAIVEGCRKWLPNLRGYTASDAVKSAFADVLKTPPADPIECPAAFLRRIVHRKYCQRLRRQALADKVQPRLAREVGVEDVAVEQLSAVDAVSFLRNNLSRVEQVVLQGKLDGLTNAGIANVLCELKILEGCGTEQVRTLWRGLVRRWRETEG